ncbi:hypothetical protein ACVWYH_005295 [Bradyrhizobium sp. GM24.11]
MLWIDVPLRASIQATDNQPEAFEIAAAAVAGLEVHISDDGR